MYEELIKRLRNVSMEYGQLDHFNNVLLREAADAIEELNRAQEQWIEQERRMLLKSIPRWIPVTERLPDAEPGDVSEQVLVTDGKDVAIVEWFNFEECEPFWGYTGFGKDVTHWMPLPEPPKEED